MSNQSSGKNKESFVIILFKGLYAIFFIIALFLLTGNTIQAALEKKPTETVLNIAAIYILSKIDFKS